MEIVKGQIVISRQGRDNTRIYMVLGTENGFVLVADGKKWLIEKPKRKNVRHLTPTKTLLSEKDTTTDHQLRAALAMYKQNIGPQTTGG